MQNVHETELAPLRTAIESRTAKVVRAAVRVGLQRGLEEALSDLLSLMGPALESSARGELSAAVARLASDMEAPAAPIEPKSEPAKTVAAKAGKPAKKVVAPAPAKPLAKDRGHRRTAEQIEELSRRVVDVVRDKGGLRAEHIAARLGLVAGDIRDILLRLVEQGRFRAEGTRRGKRYFAK